MLLQFSQSSPGIEVRNGNENTSDAGRASKMSTHVPGDLPLACFFDPLLSALLLDDVTIDVPPKIDYSIPQLMIEAPWENRFIPSLARR